MDVDNGFHDSESARRETLLEPWPKKERRLPRLGEESGSDCNDDVGTGERKGSSDEIDDVKFVL